MTALKLGAGALALSGIFHFVAVIAAGFAPGTLALLVFGALYLALAWALNRTGSRALTWLIFFMMLIFSIAAITSIGGPVPDLITWIIVLLDWICAACMFVVLWRPRAAKDA